MNILRLPIAGKKGLIILLFTKNQLSKAPGGFCRTHLKEDRIELQRQEQPLKLLNDTNIKKSKDDTQIANN